MLLPQNNWLPFASRKFLFGTCLLILLAKYDLWLVNSNMIVDMKNHKHWYYMPNPKLRFKKLVVFGIKQFVYKLVQAHSICVFVTPYSCFVCCYDESLWCPTIYSLFYQQILHLLFCVLWVMTQTSNFYISLALMCKTS